MSSKTRSSRNSEAAVAITWAVWRLGSIALNLTKENFQDYTDLFVCGKN